MSLRLVTLGQLPSALHSQLATLAPSMDLALAGPFPDAHGAHAALTAAPAPDIAFVSTSLADGSGWTLLAGLPAAQRPAAVVIFGAQDEDAVTAFDHQATDFVRLPATTERLEEALRRARQQALQLAVLRTAEELQRLLREAADGGVDVVGLMAGRAGSASANGKRRRLGGAPATGTLVASSGTRAARGAEDAVLDLAQQDGGRGDSDVRPLRVLVREGRRTRFVPLVDIDWFEADGNYIRVHAGDEAFRTRGTISSIESALDPRQYVRIHRRIVVNMDRVREMSPLPGGDGLLVLGNGSTLRLSRTYRARVR